jgi:hypothetical protein
MFMIESAKNHGRFIGISAGATGSGGQCSEDTTEKGA